MAPNADWDPEQYEKFAAQRAEPFWDLARLIDTSSPIGTMADLGCGSGELTVALADQLGVTQCIGIDSSAAMLERAAELSTDHTTFVEGDIARWTSDADHHLVFANASLQWVPDHPAVLGRWTAALRPGGQLAVQVPANSDHPSHLGSARVAARQPYLSAMGGEPPADPVAAHVLAPERYASLLHALGYTEQHVRLQVYGHLMPSTSAVVDWVRGTSLTRFFRLLPAEMHEPFVDAVRAELLAEVGDERPYFYPFKRILIWARR